MEVASLPIFSVLMQLLLNMIIKKKFIISIYVIVDRITEMSH